MKHQTYLNKLIASGYNVAEPFLFDTDVNVTENNVTNTVNNTDIKNAVTNVMNNKDLYSEINTSIDKTNEILNRATSEVNKVTDAVASTNTKQENNMSGGEFVISGADNISFKLTNENVSNIKLSVYLQSLNELDSSAYNKAMIADMLGMTNSSLTDNINSSSQDQASKQEAQGSVESTLETFKHKLRERFSLFDTSVNDVTNNVNNTTNNYNESNTTNNTENNTKETQIQNYVESVLNRTENINENIQNLKNNIAAASSVQQANKFIYDKVNITDSSNIAFDMSNTNAEEIANEFSEYMQTIQAAASSNDTQSSTQLEGSTSSDTSNSTAVDQGQTSDQAASGDASATSAVNSSVKTIAIVAIICVVLLIAFYMFIKHVINKKHKDNTTEPYVDTPVDVPVDVPVEPYVDTPVESYIDIPVDTPAKPYVDVPVDVPVNNTKQDVINIVDDQTL